MAKLSVIIPSYRDPHLNKTIESVIKSSKENIEIIVILDEFSGSDNVVKDLRVRCLKFEKNIGMRAAINTGAKEAEGEYIMKLDSHCDICDGFDVILKTQTKEDWISVPSRYNLNVDNWKKFNGPIDHLYLKFPDNFKKEIGFRYRLFEERAEYKKDEMITDIIGFQGSCWFMHKNFFEKLGGLDNSKFASFGSEAHELSMKTWLCTDGRVIRNRNTWYAHYRPPGKRSRSLRSKMLYSMEQAFKLDMLNEWDNQKRPFKWVIDKFGPFPGWSDNWHTDEYKDYLIKEGVL